MSRPSDAEILGFIARGEPLEKTLAHFPGLDRERLRSLLREAAVLMRAREEDLELAGSTPAEPEASLGPGLSRARAGPLPPEPTAAPEAPAPAHAEPAAQAVPGQPSAQREARRLRLFSDGAARGNPGPAGAGAVLTKEDGTVVARLGKYLGPQTNNVAEYSALLLGLEAALRLGAEEIEVVADSELLVRQLTGAYKVKSPGLKPLFAQAVALLARFRSSSVRHVPREQNKLADEMSNRAIDERM